MSASRPQRPGVVRSSRSHVNNPHLTASSLASSFPSQRKPGYAGTCLGGGGLLLGWQESAGGSCSSSSAFHRTKADAELARNFSENAALLDEMYRTAAREASASANSENVAGKSASSSNDPEALAEMQQIHEELKKQNLDEDAWMLRPVRVSALY